VWNLGSLGAALPLVEEAGAASSTVAMSGDDEGPALPRFEADRADLNRRRFQNDTLTTSISS
jgi:hypothetical protein